MERSSAPSKCVKCVQFSVLSPDEIRMMSVTEEGIQFPQTMEKGHPKIGGLIDPRQGVCDHRSRCITCSGNRTECSGHFGHINLAKPVFHVGFLTKVIKILRCVCFYCSSLLISKANLKVQRIVQRTIDQPRRRFAHIYELSKTVHYCGEKNEVSSMGGAGCGRYQPTIRRQGLGLIAMYKDSPTSAITVSAENVLDILSRITDENCLLLGLNPKFSRPEWMILTVLPVPPIAIRPSVISGPGTSHDDLTHKLGDIVKANKSLQTNITSGAPDRVINESLGQLQFHVASYMDNNLPNGMLPSIQRSGKPVKSIVDRLKGKEGRIRGNLMGKRVDFSARSVITADPNIGIGQVGIPVSIAKNLTYPELVGPFNIDRMQELIRRGHHQYPGANYVTRNNGERIDLRFHPKPSDLNLECGYRVERHLQDGDTVVFNRQPSLHKMSMMGHRIKVLPWSTFRLNLSCTSPYNADFDGDEMNLHVPQSLETRAEVENIHLSSKQIITPQSNKPVMGIVQDTLLGAMKMTRRDTFVGKEDLMNLLMYIPSWDGKIPQSTILKPKHLWTGKQIFSMTIPDKINLIRKHSSHNDEEDESPYKWISSADTRVIIENGEIISGILCKNTLGTSPGSLFHVCFLEVGSETTSQLYGSIQTVVNNWLLIEGHSVGIADIISDSITFKNIRNDIEESTTKVTQAIQAAHDMELEATPGNTLRQTFENHVNRILNNAREQTGSLALKSLTHFNNLKAMVVSGSKGSNLNISQIIACVGQQNVEGKRIPKGFYRRSLPHFLKGDCGAIPGGFVENSYLAGLTPSEFFFHAMAGREGLIDTAVKTAETGYIQRRLIKAMESVMVTYDGTVRNSVGQMLQTHYGEDGMCGESIEIQHFSLSTSDKTFERRHRFNIPVMNPKIFEEKVLEEINQNRDAVQEVNEEWKRLKQNRQLLREIFQTGELKATLPCDLHRMIKNAQRLFHIDERFPTNLSPLKVIHEVKALLERCSVNCNNLIFQYLIRTTFCSQLVTQSYKLTNEAFDWLIGEIESRFQQSQVNPGEMVGALAAQSLGEPATQMTLNTFHFAGISSKNVTLGVPRLKEIINISRNPKAPSLTIFLEKSAAQDAEKAKSIACAIEHTCLSDITLRTAIYYDPNVKNSCVQKDQEFINSYIEMPDFEPDALSPWLLRIELDRKLMSAKNISFEKILSKIDDAFGTDLYCMHSDDNAAELILRIHLLNNEDKLDEPELDRMEDDVFLRRIEVNLLSKMTLLGIESIKKVYMHLPQTNDRKRSVVTESGELKTISEWRLETSGTALLQVLNIRNVDSVRTYSNDICETFEVLGIEATRKCIQKEINAVFSCYGLYVNHRHLALLCEVMTANGHLMAITRHGINKQATGPLMKCSFEECVETLLDAAAYSEIDNLHGVSENIIMGKLPKMGTGCFDLLLDAEKCTKETQFLNELHFPTMTNQLKTPWIDNTQLFLSPFSWERSPASEYGSSSAFSPAIVYPFESPYQTPGNNVRQLVMHHSPHTELLSPVYIPDSPNYSPSMSSLFGGSSCSRYLPVSPTIRYSATSPVLSPLYSPESPVLKPTNVECPATSPIYSPLSPMYSPLSPWYPTISPATSSNNFSIRSQSFPMFSPLSPQYSPSSPGYSEYSPSSPEYSAISPQYSPTSPNYSLISPLYTPTSRKFLPRSPLYSSPGIPTYSPTSPTYSPTSPIYSPTTPTYSPTSPTYSPTSPKYSPTSSEYSPTCSKLHTD
ncbi:DNA-directed RNA polymerase II subunit RPB1-like isoform X2 [Hermetia illucens]|uniref:DNA-directed RNA polymerase II subunit RPB1-like isoform X2 n=1 Tax=Hermetia illucens TaxID=343691 RepID=UPI0018CC34BD|nr:DNA-directed RNA polymerase II subunit RPB1-like isoform X2 [Hermetia illucens]